MNRFLSRLPGKPALSAVAILALLAILIWFWAPLAGEAAPLASAGTRWLLIALMLVASAAWFGARLWLARRRDGGLMAGLTPQNGQGQGDGADSAAAADLAALGQRMRAAMSVLRSAHPGWRMRGRYLYQLPWYMFVGAPGSGKTTALTRSGLEFPLADTLGPESIGGIGGTRHCEWWFTDDAVLLDTAGRYTMQGPAPDMTGDAPRASRDGQHAQAGPDRLAWRGFLALLRKYRPQRPVNGVIVTVSVAELLLQGMAAREVQARAVRARIQELQEQLGMAFPVYVIVTKSDLLAGFTEFFAPCGREERAQVWGMTFALAESRAPAQALAAFPAHYRALERQLQARVLARMQDERDLQRRALVHGFPRQFAALEDALSGFLQIVFGANVFEQPALLRGVYFTSGTQEGNPIDRVMASLAASFGHKGRALAPDPASGRSYFLTRLLRDVIFREAGLAGLNPRAQRRQRLVHAALLGAGALLALTLALALGISYVRNARLVDASASAQAALVRLAAATPTGGDVLAVLPLLEAARTLPAGHAARGRAVSLLDRMGLYQGEKLGDGAVAAYRRLLRSTLETRLVGRMEDLLRRDNAGADAATADDLLYETLRVYLMLGQRRHLDAAAVQAWAELDWRLSLPQASSAQRAQLAQHVAALLEDDGAADPVQLDAALVAQVRQALAGMSLTGRIHARVKREVAQDRLPEFSVNGALGSDASGVLARASGASLARGVDGLYSLAGYRRFAALSWRAAADIARDDWVLARPPATAGQSAVAGARDAVLGLYFADYIRAWDAFLGDLRLAPLASLDDSARVSNALGGPDSVLRTLLGSAARETALAALDTEAVAPGAGKPVQGQLDRARRSLQSVFSTKEADEEADAQADAQANSAAAAPAPHPVDLHFAALHRLVAGAAPTRLDGMLEALRGAAQYFDAADSARRSGAPAPAPDALVRLKRAGEGQAAPLPALFNDVHAAGSALAQGGARERLNALWNAGPAQFCRDAIAGRYPLDRASARDATLDDFVRFFAPAGLMDDFFVRHLASAVDMRGARWRWRAGGVTGTVTGAASLSQAALDAFQRGARLRDMFFAGGARQVALRFSVRALAIDPGLAGLVFDIDGQQVTAGAQVALLVPSGKGTGQVRLATPALATELRSDGPWAWLRTVDRGTLEPLTGERYRLGFRLDGRTASYELAAGSVLNPFRRAATGFACPVAL